MKEKVAQATCGVCGRGFLAYRGDAKVCSDECGKYRHQQYMAISEARKRHPCPSCGVEIARTSHRCRPCSKISRSLKLSGENNYALKGGRRKDSYGYILIWLGPRQYEFEHRVIWEAAHGAIPDGWVLHHINGIRDDNRLENLEAMPRQKHNHRHDDHDRRILELEEENRLLRARLDGNLHSQISS